LLKSMLSLLSIADGISLLKSLFGFFSSILIFLGEVHWSFSFILLAILVDGIDGMVARKTKQGELGEYFEAMSDMTALGIAPALFIFTLYYAKVSYCPYYTSYLLIVLVVFLSCSMIRLTAFHRMKHKKYFIGLPVTAGSVLIMVPAFLEVSFFYILAIVVVVSLASIAPTPFPKPGLKINGVATILIIISILTGKLYDDIGPMILFVALMCYAIGGPLYLQKKSK